MEKTEDRFGNYTEKQMGRTIGAESRSNIPGMMTLLVGSLMQIANTRGRRDLEMKGR